MLYKYHITQRNPFPFVRRWDVYEIQPSGWFLWIGRFKKYEDAVFYTDSRILEQIPRLIEDTRLDGRLNRIRSPLVSSTEGRATPVARKSKSRVRAPETVLEPMAHRTSKAV